MKFVMTQSICPEGIEKLKADTNGQVEIIAEDNPDPNNYLDDMKDADALIVRIAKCDAHAIENSPNLKVIGRTGVGYDSVDVKKATELGIPVVITPGANNRSVAEHAVDPPVEVGARHLDDVAAPFALGAVQLLDREPRELQLQERTFIEDPQQAARFRQLALLDWQQSKKLKDP